MKALFLSLVLLSLVTHGLLAAASQYRFDSWTTDNGLPQNSINAILQTRDSYLWIATGDGLVRYDGLQFTTFNTGTTVGMSSNRCGTLFEDRQGNLWVTTDGGLIKYRGGEFTTFTRQDGLPESDVVRVFEDTGGLILATAQGFFRWPEGQASVCETRWPGLRIGCQERSGAIWFYSGQGLHRLKDAGVTTYTTKDGLSSLNIRSVYEDRRGDIWIGTADGRLHQLSQGRFAVYGLKDGLPAEPVIAILEDRQGNLWLATDGAGLWHFDHTLDRPPQTSERRRARRVTYRARRVTYEVGSGQADERILRLYEDREGIIWLGTLNQGLIRLRKHLISVLSMEPGLAGNNIYPVYEDREGSVWIGTWEKGLNRYKDGKLMNYGRQDGLASNIVTALAEDREGNLWVGSHFSVSRFKNGRFANLTNELGLADCRVYAIHQDHAATMWFGTNKGLVKYKDGVATRYTENDGLAVGDVRAVIEDRQNALWVGTYGGLSRLQDGRFTTYTKSDGLASNRVRTLYEDSEGVLWVGTNDGGLSRYKDGRFTSYSMKEGLFNNGVFQILEDARGNFWMSSNLGIYRTSRQQLNDFAEGKIDRVTCVSYGKRDGLLNIECNGGTQPAGMRARDGRLWFPTQQGVAIINPAEIPFNSEPPPVVIEQILLDRTSAAMKDVVSVLPGQEDLEIRYTGLSFIKSEQVRFRYRMEGFDRDWVEADTRRAAYYSHLPPGRYRFTVTAANADGVWNIDGASVTIVVVPPYWKTWWFSALAVAGLAAIAVVLYRRRVTMLKRANATQEAFSRQLIESQENERKRIAAELHDSLGQSLSIIANRATLALNKPEDHERALDQVGEIAAAASDAIKEVREIAYNLRPVELDRLGLTKALRVMAKRVSTSTGITILADIDLIDDLFSSESEISLYRIVQESINNIVKHSGASQARIEVRRGAHDVQVTIQDNGKGFLVGANPATDSHPAGFGLMGMSERTRMLGGKQMIQSAPGRGTTISICIDLKEGRNEG